MTSRELWRSIMFYGSFDRMPVGHWGGWPETRERWINEGLRTDISEPEYLGVTQHWGFVGVNVNLYPAFEEEILKETEEYKIFRANDGVIQQAWKKKAGIPHFIDFTLKDASQWPEYKKRLQPDPGRIPLDLDERIAQAEASGLWIAIETGSLMGWIRNWMGLQNMAYLMYDAPDVYADMVATVLRRRRACPP